MARLVVLASGAGSTLQAILDEPDLLPHVVAAGTDRPGCEAMVRAELAGLPIFAEAVADHPDRAQWDAAVAGHLAALEPDLVVLAGFMRILAPGTVTGFRIVNTHPSLLPAFPGAHAIRDALDAGVEQTGVTVHWVDEGVDTGPVIAQAAVPVQPDDDEDTLRARVQAAEKPLYIDVLRRLVKEF